MPGLGREGLWSLPGRGDIKLRQKDKISHKERMKSSGLREWSLWSHAGGRPWCIWIPARNCLAGKERRRGEDGRGWQGPSDTWGPHFLKPRSPTITAFFLEGVFSELVLGGHVWIPQKWGCLWSWEECANMMGELTYIYTTQVVSYVFLLWEHSIQPKVLYVVDTLGSHVKFQKQVFF